MPKVIALSPDQKGLAVSTWLGGVSFLSRKDGRLLSRTSKFCEHPRGLLHAPNGDLIVACYGVPDGPGQIVVLDARRHAARKRIQTGGSVRHIVKYKNDTALISNLGLGRIYLFDTIQYKILKHLPMPGQPNTIALDPGGRMLYVSLRGRNEIAVVDVPTWKVVRRYKTGAYPTGLAVSPDGKYLAVTNFHAASMNLYMIKRK